MTIHDLTDYLPNEFFAEEKKETIKEYGLVAQVLLRCVMIVGVLAALLTALGSGIASLLLWFFPRFKRRRRELYQTMCLGFACLVGAFIGIGSLRFGVTILCVYIVLHAHDGDGRVLRFLRTYCQRAFHRL